MSKNQALTLLRTTNNVFVETNLERVIDPVQYKNVITFYRDDNGYEESISFTDDELDQFILNLIDLRVTREKRR